jgi:hypothetical protein
VAKIPTALHEPINTAYPANVVQIATTLPNGFAQITLRGSVVVLDDETFGMWERGRGSTNEILTDGTKVTLFYRNAALKEELPVAGVARFYGTAEVHKSDNIYDRVWNEMIELERERDPEKKGYAILIKCERAEDFRGNAFEID